jgi:hypothetical protein
LTTCGRTNTIASSRHRPPALARRRLPDARSSSTSKTLVPARWPAANSSSMRRLLALARRRLLLALARRRLLLALARRRLLLALARRRLLLALARRRLLALARRRLMLALLLGLGRRLLLALARRLLLANAFASSARASPRENGGPSTMRLGTNGAWPSLRLRSAQLLQCSKLLWPSLRLRSAIVTRQCWRRRQTTNVAMRQCWRRRLPTNNVSTSRPPR